MLKLITPHEQWYSIHICRGHTVLIRIPFANVLPVPTYPCHFGWLGRNGEYLYPVRLGVQLSGIGPVVVRMLHNLCEKPKETSHVWLSGWSVNDDHRSKCTVSRCQGGRGHVMGR